MLYNNISKCDQRVFTVSPDKSQSHDRGRLVHPLIKTENAPAGQPEIFLPEGFYLLKRVTFGFVKPI